MTLFRCAACLAMLALFGAGAACAAPWPGYQIVMWQPKTEAQYKALRAEGVTAAAVPADRDGETAESAKRKTVPILAAGLRPYVENIATDFYSAYHRWFPGKPVNWKFLALKQAARNDPASPAIFVRDPGLSDPGPLARIETRLTETVRLYAPSHPLFFNLGDETGIADLSSAWDFDFSARSLAGMRIWLRQRYGTIGALNREWATRFRRWQDVVPPTTTAAMARSDGNYAAWSDFKEWMDEAFARSLRAGTRAVHQGAPWALAAIEGAQMPGWGGYDYSRLARAVDVMEIYDSADNMEIAQSFNPNLVFLTTSTWAMPDSAYRAWHEFLRGARGMVLWDDKDLFANPDGTPGPRGRAAMPFFAAVQGATGRLLQNSRRPFDPIAVLYSPASFRVQWMLDHRAAGSAWMNRDAETENEDDAVRAARHRTLLRLAQLGFRPRFVSDAEIAHGILRTSGYRILILPQALALSRMAAASIRDFVHAGGRVAADGETAQFDGHGRERATPLLDDLLESGNHRAIRLPQDGAQAMAALAQLIRASSLVADVMVEDAAGNPMPEAESYTFRNDGMTLAALLARPAADGTDRTLPATLVAGHRTYAYDVRTGAFLGHAQRFTTEVRSTMPVVIALTEAPLTPAQRQSRFGLSAQPSP